MEPPDLKPKRIRLVKTGKTLANSILSIANNFKINKKDRLQAGDFRDEELTDPEISHINALLAGQLYDFFAVELEVFLAGRINNDPNQPTREDFLYKFNGG